MSGRRAVTKSHLCTLPHSYDHGSIRSVPGTVLGIGDKIASEGDEGA